MHIFIQDKLQSMFTSACKLKNATLSPMETKIEAEVTPEAVMIRNLSNALTEAIVQRDTYANGQRSESEEDEEDQKILQLLDGSSLFD